MTAAVLHGELAALADKKKIAFPYENGRSLGQRLSNAEPNLRTIILSPPGIPPAVPGKAAGVPLGAFGAPRAPTGRSGLTAARRQNGVAGGARRPAA